MHFAYCNLSKSSNFPSKSWAALINFNTSLSGSTPAASLVHTTACSYESPFIRCRISTPANVFTSLQYLINSLLATLGALSGVGFLSFVLSGESKATATLIAARQSSPNKTLFITFFTCLPCSRLLMDRECIRLWIDSAIIRCFASSPLGRCVKWSLGLEGSLYSEECILMTIDRMNTL